MCSTDALNWRFSRIVCMYVCICVCVSVSLYYVCVDIPTNTHTHTHTQLCDQVKSVYEQTLTSATATKTELENSIQAANTRLEAIGKRTKKTVCVCVYA